MSKLTWAQNVHQHKLHKSLNFSIRTGILWLVKFCEKWTNGWRLRRSKLTDVHDAPGIWDEIHVTRRRAVIKNRLRCGHRWKVMYSRHPQGAQPARTRHNICYSIAKNSWTSGNSVLVCRRQNDPRIADMIGPGCKTNQVMYFLRMVQAYDLIWFNNDHPHGHNTLNGAIAKD